MEVDIVEVIVETLIVEIDGKYLYLLFLASYILIFLSDDRRDGGSDRRDRGRDFERRDYDRRDDRG